MSQVLFLTLKQLQAVITIKADCTHDITLGPDPLQIQSECRLAVGRLRVSERETVFSPFTTDHNAIRLDFCAAVAPQADALDVVSLREEVERSELLQDEPG